MVRTSVLAAILAASIGAAPTAAQEAPALTFALGANSSGSFEGFAGWRGAPVWHGFQPTVGASLSNRGEGWVGAGLAYTWRAAQQPGFLRVAVMPGLYRQGNGRNLGGAIEFRSSLEVGLRLRSGGEVALGVAHRSNAGIYNTNPGLNTAYLGYSMPLD
ncbi:MAG: Lipid A 3-O-deacylase (PagL) [Rhodobacteraceae bacterium HLUCCA12]|nr:MAG: Lipid A 3-O-deacylase (PagL) [Rhodobacteraceae bacterium HLUCCA12]